MPSTRRDFLTRAALLAAAAGLPRLALGGRPAGEPDRAAFLAAVAAGDEATVRRLLAAHPTLADAADAEGRSALVLALAAGHVAVGEALLEHDPRIDLVEAVMIPDWPRAEELAAADPARMDAWHPVGGSSLYAAALAGQTGIWRLQYLGADADANPKGRWGVTPAYGALLCRSPSDALRALTALLGNGGHVNAPQRGGDSLLHVAARRGDPALVRFLLRRGADTAARDERGRSALQHAERAGHEAAAELLRHPERTPKDDMTTRYAYDASGAEVVWPDLSDLSSSDLQGVTGPSHFDLEAVRAKVDADHRLSFARSTQDELAVEASGHTGARDIARYHLDHGVPQSLVTSLSIGDLDRARHLLRLHPGAVRERGPHDFAPMFYPSIGGGSVEAAELLLAHGCDVDQESEGTTGLHWAAASGQLDLARFLVERGARLDAVGYKKERAGQTPLAAARDAGRDAMVRLLQDLGAT